MNLDSLGLTLFSLSKFSCFLTKFAFNVDCDGSESTVFNETNRLSS